MARALITVALLMASGAAYAGEAEDDDVSSVKVKGRVEARAGAADDEDWLRNYATKAVIGADFAQGTWLDAQAEVGLQALPEVRDAWVRAKTSAGFAFQLGRFKPAFARYDLEHHWDLPIVRRGALSHQARDLGFGDRRFGVAVNFHRKHLPLKFEGEIGIFDGDPLPDGSRAEDLVLRATIRPVRHVSVGAGFYGHGAFHVGASERWLAGLDGAWHEGPASLLAEVQAGPQLAGALALFAWKFEAKSNWLEPALGAEAVRLAGSAAFVPYVVPSLAASTGRLRAVVQLELGAGREPVGSTRRVNMGASVGAAF